MESLPGRRGNTRIWLITDFFQSWKKSWLVGLGWTHPHFQPLCSRLLREAWGQQASGLGSFSGTTKGSWYLRPMFSLNREKLVLGNRTARKGDTQFLTLDKTVPTLLTNGTEAGVGMSYIGVYSVPEGAIHITDYANIALLRCAVYKPHRCTWLSAEVDLCQLLS